MVLIAALNKMPWKLLQDFAKLRIVDLKLIFFYVLQDPKAEAWI
jgi:hypothetical protein